MSQSTQRRGQRGGGRAQRSHQPTRPTGGPKRRQGAAQGRTARVGAARVGATRDPWGGAARHVAGSATQMLTSAPSGLFDVVLEVVGAEQGDIHQVLGAWERERDRVLNRAWRRPGGLARPAGL